MSFRSSTLKFLALILALLSSFLPIGDAFAQPSPELSTDNLLYTPFPGKELSICFSPSNSGDQNGFLPVIEVVVPINMTFLGASFLEIPLSYSTYTIPASGELTYSIGSYIRTVEGQPGATVAVIMPPINNIPPGETAPDVCVNLLVSEDAVIGRDHLLNSTLIFAYGSDPLDNPNVDPPQVSATLNVDIRPSLISVRKELGSGIWSADVVPTGPNYAFNYTITVSMAKREFEDLTIEDILPKQAIYVRLVSVLNLTSGQEVSSYVVKSEPVPGQYGGNLTIRIPRIRGNSDDTIRVTASMYFPYYDEQGAELISFDRTELVRNPVEVRALYEGNQVQASGELYMKASSMTYHKSVSMYRDNYAIGYSRFDVLEYTVTFWLSDYYNASVITFSDTLGDGQRILRNMTPIFYVVNGSNVYSGIFPSDAYYYGVDHSGPGGTTPLFFNLTKALEESGAPGDLRGGMVGNESWRYSGDEFKPPFGRGRTWGYLKFWSYIEEEYSYTVPGDQQVDSGDSIPNEVEMNAEYESASWVPPDIGRSTRVSIERPRMEKSIAYINGQPPSEPVQVKAGDYVTFRLKIYIPTANADHLEFYDQLPLPVFRVSSFSAGQIPSSNIPPPAENWAIGPDDNVTSTTGLTPELFLVDVTANKLGFRYNSPIHADNKTLLIADIMYTLEVTDEPFGDLLHLANLATMSYKNSFQVINQQSAVKLIRTQSPYLVIRKDVVSSSQGTIEDGNLSGADAGDDVTFQVYVTNEGHWNAYDVVIRDEIQKAGSNYYLNLRNLKVYECDGSTEWDPSKYTFTIYPDSSAPQYLEISLSDGVVLPPGSCLIIKYDLTIGGSVHPLQRLINNGSIIHYASIEGGENFVDPKDPPRDSASVTIAQPSIGKYLDSTDQAFTSGDTLAVGEEAVFGLKVTLPEGTTADLKVVDTLPGGFTYAGSVDLDSSGFYGSIPAYSVSYDPASRNVTITFQGSVIVHADNNPGNNAFTLKVHARVDNSYTGWVPSSNPWERINRASMDWYGNPGPELHSSYSVYVGTPMVSVYKSFLNADYTAYTPKDAGDYVIMNLTIINSGYLDAFDITLTDSLDYYVDLSSLTLDSQVVPPGVTVSWYLTFNTLTVTVDKLPGISTSSPPGRAVELYFKFRLADNVIAGWTYYNNASCEYTTLPGVSEYEKKFNSSSSASLMMKNPQLSKVVQSTSNPDTSSNDLAIGEEVVFRIALTLPEGNLSDITLTDTWPQGFGYINHTIDTSQLSGIIPSPSVSVDQNNRRITITFPGWTHVNADNDPSNDILYVYLALKVLNDPSNVGYPARGSKTNSVTMSWNNMQLSASRTVYIVEPHLSVSKSFNVSYADAGDWVRLTILLTNNGLSPAYEVNLTDVLDPGVFDPSSVREVSTPAGFTFSFNSITGEVRYEGGKIGNGQTLTFVIDAKIREDVTTLSSYLNEAEAEGSSMPGHLDVERTYSATGSATLTIGATALSKDLVGTSESSTAGNKVTIGEIVLFNLTASIPEGVMRNVTFYDLLPRNSGVLMSFMNANVTVNRGGVSSNVLTLTPGSWTPISPTQTGNSLAFYLGDITNSNSDPQPELITVRVKLLVLNLAENYAGRQLINGFKIGYTNTSNNYVYTQEVQSTLTIAEPQLWSILTADPITVGWSGDEVLLHFNVTNLNTATSSTAYDLQLLELLPPEFSGLQIIGVQTSHAGTIADLSTSDQLKLLVSYLEPGGWINVTFKIVLQPNAIFGQSIPLLACASGTTTPGDRGSWGSIPGDPGNADGERTGTGVEPNHIRACDDASVTVGTPNVNKDVLTPKLRYAPGDQVRYQITIGTPKGSTGDLKVIDTLAEGLTYSDDLEVDAPSGVTFSNTPSESPPFFSRTDTGTVEVLTFDFGSFTNSNSHGVNTYLRFNATVEDHPANVDGKTLTNEVILTYMDSSNREQTVGPAQVSVTVGEPLLRSPIKQALTELRGGQVTWFTLSFVNEGTTAAYDTIVTDYLPPELRGGTPIISYIRIGSRTLSSSDYEAEYFESNGTLRITFLTPEEDSSARIEPGESVEIKIGAIALPHVPLNYRVTNAFEVRAYTSRPGSPDQERAYSDGTASTIVSSPEPEVRKVVFSTRTPPPDPNDPTRSNAVVGEVVVYNITFRMPQGTLAYDVRFSDIIPDGLEVINASARGINATGLIEGVTTVTESNGRYFVEAIFGKLADAEVNVTIYARVNYYYSSGSIVMRGDVLVNGNSTNACKYTYSNGAEYLEVYSNEAIIEILSSGAELQIEKSFSPDLLKFGESTTATITVRNVGSGTSYQTILRDLFCESFEFLSANVTPDRIAGNEITWNIGELDPGESWSVSVDFKLIACGCLNNNATVSWIDAHDPTHVREAETSDEVSVITDLEFEKSVNPDYIRAGEVIKVTLIVRNPTCIVVRNLNFTDLLPEGLTYVQGSSKLNGSAIGDPSVEGSTLIWNTSLTLEPGKSYVLEYLARAEAEASTGERTNWAGVVGKDPSETMMAAEDTADLFIMGQRGGILVRKSVSPLQVSVNDTVTFTITIINRWDVPVLDVEIWDLLPCCLTYAGGSTVLGTPAEPEHSIELPPGYAVITVTGPVAEGCRGDRILRWHLDRIDPGETVVISFNARALCTGFLKNTALVYCRTEGGQRSSGRAEAMLLTYGVPKIRAPSYGSESKMGPSVKEDTQAHSEIEQLAKNKVESTSTVAESPVMTSEERVVFTERSSPSTETSPQGSTSPTLEMAPGSAFSSGVIALILLIVALAILAILGIRRKLGQSKSRASSLK